MVDDAGAEVNARARNIRLSDAWFGWDAPILAPGDGEVVEVEANVADNAMPGMGYVMAQLGNYVVIRHREGEYSVLAFLKKGSPTVKPGDKVVAGQTIGRCGNSGASLYPHLRFAVLDQSDPMLCRRVSLAGWAAKGKGEPAAGDLVTGVTAAVVPSATILAAPQVSATAAVSPSGAVSATASLPSAPEASATKAEPAGAEAAPAKAEPPAADKPGQPEPAAESGKPAIPETESPAPEPGAGPGNPPATNPGVGPNP